MRVLGIVLLFISVQVLADNPENAIPNLIKMNDELFQPSKTEELSDRISPRLLHLIHRVIQINDEPILDGNLWVGFQSAKIEKAEILGTSLIKSSQVQVDTNLIFQIDETPGNQCRVGFILKLVNQKWRLSDVSGKKCKIIDPRNRKIVSTRSLYYGKSLRTFLNRFASPTLKDTWHLFSDRLKNRSSDAFVSNVSDGRPPWYFNFAQYPFLICVDKTACRQLKSGAEFQMKDVAQSPFWKVSKDQSSEVYNVDIAHPEISKALSNESFGTKEETQLKASNGPFQFQKIHEYWWLTGIQLNSAQVK